MAALPQTARLSSKGQIVLPLRIRAERDLKPGTEFTVENTADGVLLRPVKLFPKTTLDMVVGCLRYKGKPKTLAQMDAGVIREVKKRHARGRS